MDKKINIAIELTRDDRTTKRSKFTGYAYVEAGFLTGSFIGRDSLETYERVLLTAFTFTGCPLAARTQNPNLNPWMLTGGEYSARRRLESSAFVSTSTIESRTEKDQIRMRLSVDICGRIDQIRDVRRPFQETIFEREIGIFEGEFELDFATDTGGKILRSRAVTEYKLDVDRHFERMWRNITIVNSGGTQKFRQVEQIDLFGDSQIASRDLLSKRKVSGL